MLLGDADRIQQVLLNLLSNARKYVPKNNGRIMIESELQQHDESLILKISVTDNGPGISELDQQKLFKPFSKLGAYADLNPNGLGLGLSICKLICNCMGGDIVVESENGTKFTYWVAVKNPVEHDFYIQPTERTGL